MKARIILFLLLIFSSIGHTSTAQSSIKTVGGITWECQCTSGMVIGDTLKYSYRIVNNGSTNIQFWETPGITPNIENMVKVSQGGATSLQYGFVNHVNDEMALAFQSSGTGSNVFINAGDTATMSVLEKTDPFYYKVGNNSLVIWPENVHGIENIDSMKADIVFSAATNANFQADNSFKVYPNPSYNGIVNVSAKSLVNRYQIIDSFGRLVQMGRFENELRITDLKVGLYTVKLIDKNNVYQSQIVVKK